LLLKIVFLFQFLDCPTLLADMNTVLWKTKQWFKYVNLTYVYNLILHNYYSYVIINLFLSWLLCRASHRNFVWAGDTRKSKRSPSVHSL